MTELFPDLISADTTTLIGMLDRIAVGKGDIINNRCVSHEHDGPTGFYVQGHRKALTIYQAAQKLVKHAKRAA
jgi:hypothetical protein